MPRPRRVVLYDRGCTEPPFLTQSWVIGAALARIRGQVDAVHGASSWREALAWLANEGREYGLAEVQFWGHGKWGRALIGGDAIDAARIREDADTRDQLREISASLAPGALWWWRTCETFGAASGHDFAQDFGERLGCRVAGHTFIIGPWQSGLHSLAPGCRPDWPQDEGLASGTPRSPRGALWSRAWRPRTIACLRMTIPDGW